MKSIFSLLRKSLRYVGAIVCVGTGALVWVLDPYLSRGTGSLSLGVDAAEAASDSLFVFVAGGVRQPGTYVLPAAARVADAITAAGGFAENVDRQKVYSEVNLAEVLTDAMHVVVPVLPPPTAAVSAAGKINLNTATTAELDTLPGIGPATAAKIIAGRPYARLEDLLEVPGIGESRISELSSLVTW